VRFSRGAYSQSLEIYRGNIDLLTYELQFSYPMTNSDIYDAFSVGLRTQANGFCQYDGSWVDLCEIRTVGVLILEVCCMRAAYMVKKRRTVGEMCTSGWMAVFRMHTSPDLA
jgi:hypothetical protein